MAKDTEYVLTLLEEYGMATHEQIVEARKEAMAQEDFELDAVDILCRKGVVQEMELLSMLAQQYGMEMIDLTDYEIPEEVINSLDQDIARHYMVVPVMKHDDLLTVAMSDPTDMEKLDTLRYLLKGDVDAVIAPESQIKKMIDKYYLEDEEQLNQMVDEADLNESDMVITSAQDTPVDEGAGPEDDATPIIRLVTKLIVDAYKMKA